MGIGIGNRVNNYFGGRFSSGTGGMMKGMNPLQMLMQGLGGLTGGPCKSMDMMGKGDMMGMGGIGNMMGMGGFSPMAGNCVGNFLGMQQNPMMQIMQMMQMTMQMMQMMIQIMGGGADPFMGGMMPGMMGGMPVMGSGMMPGMVGGGTGAFAGIDPNGQPYAGAYAGGGAGQSGDVQANPNQQISNIANPGQQQVGQMIEQAAAKYGVPVNILKAVAWNESNWKQSATGDNGQSHGIMQIYKSAHPDAYQGAENVGNSAAKNIEYGAKFLSNLHKQYGSWEMAVKRYNGSGPMADAYEQKVMGYAQSQPWKQSGLA